MTKSRTVTQAERLITWNVGGKAAALIIRAILDLIAKYAPAAIVLQEVADRDGVLTEVVEATGYRLTRFDRGEHSKSVAILTRPDIEHDGDSDAFQLSKRRKVGKKVAGAKDDGYTPAKWVVYTRVRFFDTNWIVASTHLTPSHHVKAARLLVAAQVAVIAAWMRTSRRVVALGGDFNATPTARWNLLAPLRLLATPFTAPSFGARAIDYWWLVMPRLEKRGITVAVQALDGYPSDHDPVMVTLTRPVDRTHACPTCGLVHETPLSVA
jgi:exonuclease III